MKLSSAFFLTFTPFYSFYSLSQNLPVYVKVTNFFFCELYQNYKNRDSSLFSKVPPILSLLSFSYSGIGRGWKCVEAPTPTVDQGVVPPWRKILLIRVSTLFSYLLSSLSLTYYYMITIIISLWRLTEWLSAWQNACDSSFNCQRANL